MHTPKIYLEILTKIHQISHFNSGHSILINSHNNSIITSLYSRELIHHNNNYNNNIDLQFNMKGNSLHYFKDFLNSNNNNKLIRSSNKIMMIIIQWQEEQMKLNSIKDLVIIFLIHLFSLLLLRLSSQKKIVKVGLHLLDSMELLYLIKELVILVLILVVLVEILILIICQNNKLKNF